MFGMQDDSAGSYRLAEGVAIADERELRQLIRPEEWCAVESATNALAHLSQQGITQQDRLSAIPLERLRIAAEQLSPPEVSCRIYTTGPQSRGIVSVEGAACLIQEVLDRVL